MKAEAVANGFLATKARVVELVIIYEVLYVSYLQFIPDISHIYPL